MNIPLQVVSMELNSINLLGDKKQDYVSLPNTKLYKSHVDEVLNVSFSSEEEVLIFLQRMVDEGVPFFDSYYKDGYSAYFDAKGFVSKGKLKGHVVRSVWQDGAYHIDGPDD